MVSQRMSALSCCCCHLLPCTCPRQREFGACDEQWMKDGNYCLYTCGRAKNCGGRQEGQQGESKGTGGGSAAGGQGGSTKPGDRNVCDDIQPPGEYTCRQQVRGP